MWRRLVTLYNPRRDGGAHGLPWLQLQLANGAAALPAPNGSSTGVVRPYLLLATYCLLLTSYQ